PGALRRVPRRAVRGDLAAARRAHRPARGRTLPMAPRGHARAERPPARLEHGAPGWRCCGALGTVRFLATERGALVRRRRRRRALRVRRAVLAPTVAVGWRARVAAARVRRTTRAAAQRRKRAKSGGRFSVNASRPSWPSALP